MMRMRQHPRWKQAPYVSFGVKMDGAPRTPSIPIKRTKKDDVLRASSVERYWKKSHGTIPNPTSSYLPAIVKGHEHATVYVKGDSYYGAKATMNVWNPKLESPFEFSLSQLWIVGGPDQLLDTIEAGWHVYPGLHGDNKTRPFIYWTDPKSGNWWLQYGNLPPLGYWPSSLFPYLTNGCVLVEWGGEIVNLNSNGQHTSTQMGSGHFAEEGYGKASYIRNIQIVDQSNNLQAPQGLPLSLQDPTAIIRGVTAMVTSTMGVLVEIPIVYRRP
ncbi:hypothetical protein COCNU_14G012440 [Cocos nucifera]|uniref:Neprosin PEP catalytic domain-containing protein n=1 Tax=Cocos nucifera TaxID=13894 RepID=A0A8K0IW37_COCNU|nr:hypothetical protein COCNU_14G012440 [Cocos nucifera]